MSLKHYKFQAIKQKGSALMLALFVMIIMTLLGTVLVKMYNSSSEAVAYEVLGTRAYAAAQTGIQWQLTEIFPLNETNITLCTSTIEPDISTAKGLENCSFSVSCDSNISFNGIQYYTLESVGSCDVAGIKTSRTIEVEARSLD